MPEPLEGERLPSGIILPAGFVIPAEPEPPKRDPRLDDFLHFLAHPILRTQPCIVCNMVGRLPLYVSFRAPRRWWSWGIHCPVCHGSRWGW